jgi:SAM-dependent methyltransferase
MNNIWENQIAINSDKEHDFEVLNPAIMYLDQDSRRSWWDNLNYSKALALDNIPLPIEKDREGYYENHHFSYWASGFQDHLNLLDVARKYHLDVNSFLDFGCSSGRVTRHFGILTPDIKTFGCDINRLHVEWCNRFLPPSVITFQNHSIPSLPIPDNSIDMISAFSVFTHIEAFETTWLMELKRVLTPGGILWLTTHTEHTLKAMDETWPLFKPVHEHPRYCESINSNNSFTNDRMVLRHSSNSSYSSNVFYKEAYIKHNWSRFFKLLDFIPRGAGYQDAVVLRK